MGQIIDVFGGAGEVDEFGHRLQLRVTREPLLDEVLHRFHIVIGGGLDVLDASGIDLVEVVDDLFQQFIGLPGKGRHFGDARVSSQALQPADFHQYPALYQAELAEYLAQRDGLTAVTAIDRGNGGQCGQFHVLLQG